MIDKHFQDFLCKTHKDSSIDFLEFPIPKFSIYLSNEN